MLAGLARWVHELALDAALAWDDYKTARTHKRIRRDLRNSVRGLNAIATKGGRS